jgi:putative transposase
VLAPKAPPIQLSPEEERALSRLVRVHSTPQKLAKRARIILLGAAGNGIGESAAALRLWRKTVQHWRRRWEAAASTARVAERLSDAPHSGAPVTFTVEQIRHITALACEDPERLPRPLLLNRDQLEGFAVRARWRVFGIPDPLRKTLRAAASISCDRGRFKIRLKSGHKAGSKRRGWSSSGPGGSFMSSMY